MNLKIGQKRVFGFILNSRGLAQIPLMIVLLVMAIAIPIATRLVQQQQDSRSKAAYPITGTECNSSNCGWCSESQCKTTSGCAWTYAGYENVYYCSTSMTKVNGSCGTTKNSCVAGALSDIADSATQYLWDCVGQGGGITAHCSTDITCSSLGGSCKSTSDCAGIGGIPVSGSSDCSASTLVCCKPVGAAVNGVCSTTTKNGCISGTFADVTDTDTQYLWKCTGLNGGAAANCSMTNTNTYDYGTILCGVGLGMTNNRYKCTKSTGCPKDISITAGEGTYWTKVDTCVKCVDNTTTMQATCQLKAVGESCIKDSECSSTVCSTSTGKCIAKNSAALGTICSSDAECVFGSICGYVKYSDGTIDSSYKRCTKCDITGRMYSGTCATDRCLTPSGNPSAKYNECATTSSVCTSGQIKCLTNGIPTYLTCENGQWGASANCPSGQVCSNGACVSDTSSTSCTSSTAVGTKYCNGTSMVYQYCNGSSGSSVFKQDCSVGTGGMKCENGSCVSSVTYCTSYTYGSWGACSSSGTQTRTLSTSSPSGCTIGTVKPVLSQSCTPPITLPGVGSACGTNGECITTTSTATENSACTIPDKGIIGTLIFGKCSGGTTTRCCQASNTCTAEGARDCSGTKVRVCTKDSSSGVLAWVESNDCGNIGCTSGVCNTCTPGQQKCLTTSTYTACNNGQWSPTSTACGTDKSCTIGTINNAVCVTKVGSLCSQCKANSGANNGNILCKSSTNVNDISIWIGEFDFINHESKNTWKADMNCDGRVMSDDLSIIISKFSF